MKKIKIKIINEWHDFFKLSEKDKKISRIENNEFLKFMGEATVEQKEEYNQVIHARVLKIPRKVLMEFIELINSEIFNSSLL